MTAVLAILLILVGLPLLAYWLGGRGVWSRLRPGAEADPWRDVVRRHRLSSSDAPRVAHAVPRGLALAEPHLRQAAVDWAERLIEQESVRWPTTRKGRLLAGAAVLWFVGVVAFLVQRLVTGRPEDVNWVTVAIVVGFGIGSVHRRRMLRRTIELNRDEPAIA
ncbi:hypothetical protein SAMN05660485_01054 [Blastococcus fimeti]|nr:hypothetical protein SAMN05660485_01054 [Blastococcus fimeti]